MILQKDFTQRSQWRQRTQSKFRGLFVILSWNFTHQFL